MMSFFLSLKVKALKRPGAMATASQAVIHRRQKIQQKCDQDPDDGIPS
jgi:hypothetical protein